jgi:hypothetical protein
MIVRWIRVVGKVWESETVVGKYWVYTGLSIYTTFAHNFCSKKWGDMASASDPHARFRLNPI